MTERSLGTPIPRQGLYSRASCSNVRGCQSKVAKLEDQGRPLECVSVVEDSVLGRHRAGKSVYFMAAYYKLTV